MIFQIIHFCILSLFISAQVSFTKSISIFLFSRIFLIVSKSFIMKTFIASFLLIFSRFFITFSSISEAFRFFNAVIKSVPFNSFISHFNKSSFLEDS